MADALPEPHPTMWRDFKAFLLKQNIVSLAVAVVIGTATNDLVQALVRDFIMPIIEAFMPTDAWQEATLGVGPVEFLVGDFAAVALRFLIVGLVAWRIAKAFVRPPKPTEKPSTRPCPFCRMDIDAQATRCAHCTSQLEAAAA